MEFNMLEGPAYDAFLKLIDAVKKEGARLNNLTMEEAWGKAGALQMVQLLPQHVGVGAASVAAANRLYGYRFTVAVAAADGLFNLAPVPAGRVIGIWGWVDSTPGLRLSSQLNITVGSRLARQWPMPYAQGQINDAAHRLDPLLIPASKNFIVTNACYLAGDLDFMWLGVYAEPKS